MQFNLSFCDPFQKDIINLGALSSDAIIRHFESIPWMTYLSRMSMAREEDIYYSPSLEIANSETKEKLSISAVGESDEYEFYIFYKRHRMIKTISGQQEIISTEHITDITGQTMQDVIDCLHAFTRNDSAFLEKKIGI
ncbi:MAG TPA: hypothetical protein VGN63_02845 [Flavisolibacter sp.]|jgi:hypothetical protein|nr:hypothetical protein [Flavisolibacter sp.]